VFTVRMAELKATKAGRAQRSKPADVMKIAVADLVSLKASDVGMTDLAVGPSRSNADGFTDGGISKNERFERTLVAWTPGAGEEGMGGSDAGGPANGGLLEDPAMKSGKGKGGWASSAQNATGAGGAWDQFAANKEMFGVDTSFDESVYTTAVQRGGSGGITEREAARIAREIQNLQSTNVHMQEERGQRVTVDYDEEDLYGAVVGTGAAAGGQHAGNTTLLTKGGGALPHKPAWGSSKVPEGVRYALGLSQIPPPRLMPLFDCLLFTTAVHLQVLATASVRHKRTVLSLTLVTVCPYIAIYSTPTLADSRLTLCFTYPKGAGGQGNARPALGLAARSQTQPACAENRRAGRHTGGDEDLAVSVAVPPARARRRPGQRQAARLHFERHRATVFAQRESQRVRAFVRQETGAAAAHRATAHDDARPDGRFPKPTVPGGCAVHDERVPPLRNADARLHRRSDGGVRSAAFQGRLPGPRPRRKRTGRRTGRQRPGRTGTHPAATSGDAASRRGRGARRGWVRHVPAARAGRQPVSARTRDYLRVWRNVRVALRARVQTSCAYPELFIAAEVARARPKNQK